MPPTLHYLKVLALTLCILPLPLNANRNAHKRQHTGSIELSLPTDPNALESEKIQKLIVLDRILSMPPDKLAELRQSLERIEAMSPEQKKTWQSQIKKFIQLKKDKRKAIAQKFDQMPESSRKALREKLFRMPPQERKALREKLKGMSPEDRQNWRQQFMSSP